ncbi:hypothetical protein [Mesorhizobium sp. M0859]|uniref:hypothetical protein n=1 Tax=Mesorhizobium sp. M0859 TaxID=2957014 RepID=UPI003338087E
MVEKGNGAGDQSGHKPATDINAFLKSEPFWLAAAFVTGLSVIFMTLVAAANAVFTLTGTELADRVDVIYKLALIGVGVVTFCTVVWRGLISARQADAQRDQIAKLAEQSRASERSNLAGLLQKGAELIAEKDHPARVAAGIASLQAVGEGSEDRYGTQAMEILADYLEGLGSRAFTSPLGKSAINALADITKRTNRWAARTISFSNDPEDYDPEYDFRFSAITGVFEVHYGGGSFLSEEFSAKTTSPTGYRFDRTTFDECEINMRCGQWDRCTFETVKFTVADFRRSTKGTYENCDFSGCSVFAPETFPDLRAGRNWCDPKNPPVFSRGAKDFDWTHKLDTAPTADFIDDDDDGSLFGPSK